MVINTGLNRLMGIMMTAIRKDAQYQLNITIIVRPIDRGKGSNFRKVGKRRKSISLTNSGKFEFSRF